MTWLTKILGREKKKRAGFTLVELMIVVIVVGILAAAAIPIYWWAMARAYSSEARALLGAIRSVQQIWYAEHNAFWDPTTTPAQGPDFTSDDTLDTSIGIKAHHNKWWHAPQLSWAATDPSGVGGGGVGTGTGPWVLADGATGKTAIQKIQIAIGLHNGEFLVSYDTGANWKNE